MLCAHSSELSLRIDAHFLIKITDFGLSEDVFERNYFRQDSSSGEAVKLPVKWMAPESLSDGHFSEKSDVVGTQLGSKSKTLFHSLSLSSLPTVVIWSDNVGDIQWREGSIPGHQSPHSHGESGTRLPDASTLQ